MVDESNCVACPICKMLFINNNFMLAHKNHMHGGTLYDCDICGFVMKSKRHFQRHSLRHKDNNNFYTCNECNYKTNRNDHLLRHLQYHDDSYLKIFKICGKKFNRIDNLKRLLRTHKI